VLAIITLDFLQTGARFNMDKTAGASIVLICLEGISWHDLLSYCDNGLVPNIAAMRRQGRAAPLLDAPVGGGPAAMATLVSGVHPEAHRIWQPADLWLATRTPLDAGQWQSPPAWARLAAAGIATGSVAMPASRPGAGWDGTHFDDSLLEPTGTGPEDWALPRSVAPPAAREAVRDRRVHPADITTKMLQPLVPGIAAIDQGNDRLLPLLAVALARAATVQAAASTLFESAEAAAVFINHDLVGALRPVFGHLVEGQWAAVLPTTLRLLDAMIAEIARQAGTEALLLLVSPGWQGKPGFLLASGQGVEPDDGEPVSCLDILPAVLARFGLHDAALAGSIPAGLGLAVAAQPAPSVAMPPSAATLPAALQAASLAVLAASVLRRAPASAACLAREALAIDALHPGALRVLAAALVLLDDGAALPAVAQALRQVAPSRGWGPLAEAAAHVLADRPDLAAPLLAEAEADPEADTLLTVAAVWLAAGRPQAADRVFGRVLAIDPANLSARLGLAYTAIGRRDFAAAETRLAAVLADDPAIAMAHAHYATLCLRTGRTAEARRRWVRALKLDPALDRHLGVGEGLRGAGDTGQPG
jgi:tetratricopeptide (TPR) repeat protein